MSRTTDKKCKCKGGNETEKYIYGVDPQIFQVGPDIRAQFNMYQDSLISWLDDIRDLSWTHLHLQITEWFRDNDLGILEFEEEVNRWFNLIIIEFEEGAKIVADNLKGFNGCIEEAIIRILDIILDRKNRFVCKECMDQDLPDSQLNDPRIKAIQSLRAQAEKAVEQHAIHCIQRQAVKEELILEFQSFVLHLIQDKFRKESSAVEKRLGGLAESLDSSDIEIVEQLYALSLMQKVENRTQQRKAEAGSTRLRRARLPPNVPIEIYVEPGEELSRSRTTEEVRDNEGHIHKYNVIRYEYNDKEP